MEEIVFHQIKNILGIFDKLTFEMDSSKRMKIKISIKKNGLNGH